MSGPRFLLCFDRRAGIRSLLLLAWSASPAFAQSIPLPQHVVRFSLASGAHGNPGSAAAVAWTHFIDFGPTAPWARFIFEDSNLPAGSALRVTSLLDGETQVLDAFEMGQWGETTAYLNGSQYAFELVAGPGTSGTRVTISAAFVGDGPAPGPAPAPETICGANDNRAPTTEYAICRLLTGTVAAPTWPSGCTGFMINVAPAGNANDRCLLTAGHCLIGPPTGVQVSTVAQFNVGNSNGNCTLVHPGLANSFPVTAVIGARSGGIGNDWGVFRLGVNNANQTSFQRQTAVFAATPGPGGIFGPVALPLAAAINVNTTVRVEGYGVDITNVLNAPGGTAANCPALPCPAGTLTGTWNQILQSITGTLNGWGFGVVGGQPISTLSHDVDTCGANSGSPILATNNVDVIGIHTNGGCTAVIGTNNAGTGVLQHATLQGTINACGAPGGGFVNVGGGCGSPPPSLTPLGTPVVGTTVSFVLGGAVGLGAMWLGVPVFIPICPPCILLADLGVIFTGLSFLSVPIPLNTSLVGAVVAVQAADVFSATGCPASVFGFPFRLTDTIDVTIF